MEPCVDEEELLSALEGTGTDPSSLLDPNDPKDFFFMVDNLLTDRTPTPTITFRIGGKVERAASPVKRSPTADSVHTQCNKRRRDEFDLDADDDSDQVRHFSRAPPL